MYVKNKIVICFESLFFSIALFVAIGIQAVHADESGSDHATPENASISSEARTPVLTLQRAERVAIEEDPARAEFEAQAQALYEQAIAEGQLPDPTVRLGYVNVPTDTFNRSQEPMTQVLVGVQQTFPPGDTLALRKRQVNAMGQTMTLSAAQQRLNALQSVRDIWLDVFYWHTAAEIVRDSHGLFTQLTAITRSQYATGRRNQQDVLRAEQELGVLKDREINYQTEEIRARAKLARWIGESESQGSLPVELPDLPGLPDVATMQSMLDRHPSLLVAQSRITAQEQDVAIAKETYKPRWMIDVSYGNRDGNNSNGSPRADFVSGMVSFSVPLFTADRQDRKLAASRQRLLAAQDARELQRRQLQQELKASQAQWQYLGQRVRQYQQALLPQAKQTAQAALQAYQTDAGDFALLMRARINELETNLQLLKLRTDRARAHSNLLFLIGEESGEEK